MTGRPSTYTQAEADAICNHIAEGKSLAAYCRVNGVGYSTVMQWLAANDAFAENYARAREAAGDADADIVTDIRERLLAGEIDAATATAAVNAAKWTAGIRQPKKYGPKMDLTSNGEPVAPVTINVIPVSARP